MERAHKYTPNVQKDDKVSKRDIGYIKKMDLNNKWFQAYEVDAEDGREMIECNYSKDHKWTRFERDTGKKISECNLKITGDLFEHNDDKNKIGRINFSSPNEYVIDFLENDVYQKYTVMKKTNFSKGGPGLYGELRPKKEK